MERKLTAILCADVFGYSRLMGEDEGAILDRDQHLKPNRSRPLRQKGSLLLPSIAEQFFSRFENWRSWASRPLPGGLDSTRRYLARPLIS